MTTQTSTATEAAAIVPIVLAVLIGLGVVYTTGLAHAETLHDAAHDMRHATGFPCH